MNLESLDLPIVDQDLRRFKQASEHSQNKSFWEKSLIITDAEQWVVIVVGLVGTILAAIISGLFDSGGWTVLIIMAVWAVMIIGVLFVGRLRRIHALRSSYVVSRLAAANRWSFLYSMRDVSWQGILFTAGHDYEFSDVVFANDFSVGRCYFKTGSGRNERSHRYGFMVMTLKGHFPHMLLDSKSNNFKAFGFDSSNLPISFKRNQIISLEGDFDTYYSLYAPGDYDIDARYIFTPDLMSVLIDESDNIDIEIIDNRLFVYFGSSDMNTAKFWRKVERLHMQLGSKLALKSERYKDDRTTDGSVSQQGMRLKTSVPIISIVIIVAYIVLQVVRYVNE